MASGVHPAAARGFELAADAYERGRPGYPAVAVERIREVLGVGPGSTVLDVAAGTGKLTASLVGPGVRVLAVEPVEAMRQVLRRRVPRAWVLAATAERLPLATGSVEAVTVAQAFHWFDAGSALAEFHRVLRPAGALVLVWNYRDESVSWVAELTRILNEARTAASVPRHAGQGWRPAVETSPLFGPLHQEGFPHVVRQDLAGVTDRVASISFVATLPEPERRTLLAEVRDLVQKDAEQVAGRFAFPYVTRLYWARRA